MTRPFCRRWWRRPRWWVGLGLLPLLAAGLLLVVGCGPRGSGAGAQEPVRLELWTLALRPTFTDYMEDLVADFEAEHPGVEVAWVDVPFDALSRKLVSAAAAGRAPDVVNFSDMQFARFAALGATADHGPLLPGDPAERYFDGALRIARIDGRLQGLPWYLSTSVRLVNAEHLARGGLTPDTLADNWTDLRAQARAYHEATGGFLFSVMLGEESDLPMMLMAEGLAPFEVQGGRLRARLTTPAIVDYVSGWVALYRDGALPRSAATVGHAALIEGYQNGRLGMVQTGANFLMRIRDVAPDVYAHTEVLPGVTGRLGRSHIAVMLVSVLRSSEHPELAAELAWHVTSPANQLRLAKIVDILPSTPASLADAHFDPPAAEASAEADAQHKLDVARAVSARALRHAVAFTPALSAWPDMRRAFNETIKGALLEGRDVAETLAAIERQWKRELDAAGETGTLEQVPTPPPVGEAGAAR